MSKTSETASAQASLLKTLAHPVRLEILRYLAKGPACAGTTNETIGISQPNLSQHLKALKGAGLIDCEIDGPKRCYFIIRPTLVQGLLNLLDAKHPTQRCPKRRQD